jgi:hypothetical protein
MPILIAMQFLVRCFGRRLRAFSMMGRPQAAHHRIMLSSVPLR